MSVHLTSPAPPQRLIHRLAWLCAILVLAVTSLSAFIRLSRAGVGCTPWPQCYGQQHQASAVNWAVEKDNPVAQARQAHRVTASASLLLALALLVLARKGGAALRPAARMAAGVLALALWLAVLGVLTGASRLPAVTLGNLLGGLLMFALCVRLALATRSASATEQTSPLAAPAWIGSALVLAQMALGGLVSAGDAGLSCTVWGSCALGATPDGWSLWQATPAGTLPTHAAGAPLHLLHRAGGIALLAFLLWLSWRVARHGRIVSATLLTALPLLQILLGLGIVAQQLPLAPVLWHNGIAAVLLAVVLALSLPAPATSS